MLDSQAGALIVSLGEGGMDFRAGCEMRSVRKKKIGLVLPIIGSRTSAIFHWD